MRIVYSLLITVVLLMTSCGPKEFSPVKLATLKVLPTEEYNRSGEGDIITLRNGDILTMYGKFNSNDDFSHASLVQRISRDRGLTWSEEEIIIEREGNVNLMSFSLLRLQNGSIALFYLVKDSMLDCHPVMRISTDEAKSWSEPKALIESGVGYYVLNNCRVIQLADGRIIVPLAEHPVDKGTLEYYGTDFCLYSDDNGATWNRSEIVPNPDGIHMHEPGVVELSDGRILMYIRCDRGLQYFSYSEDRGETWSDALPSTLKSAFAPALIVTEPRSGDLLAWHVIPPKDRTSMRINPTLSISKDFGETWVSKILLQSDTTIHYCYPAIDFPSDDRMVISYYAGAKSKWGLEGSIIETYRF